MLIPSRRAEDLFAGWWRLIDRLGAVPRTLVWDGEGAIGRWRGGKTELTGDCQAFRGVLGTKVIVLKPREPEHKGIIERAHDYLERSFLPGRTFAGPDDFNTQLQDWLAMVNARRRRALGCAPTDRIAADRAAMLALPPVAAGDRLAVLDAAGPGPLRPPRLQRLLGPPGGDRPPDRGRRRPGPGPGVLRGPGRRRPRAGLGLAPDPHRPRPPRRPPTLLRRSRVGAAAPGPGSTRSSSGRWPTTTPPSASTWADRRRGAPSMTARKTTTAATKTGRDLTAEVAFLTRALKAPTLREAVPRLAERARAESWTHEEFLVACLQREVSARESHGGEGRIRAARFPARKSLEEFDFDHARGLKRDLIAHLGTLDFVTARENVVFLGPPGTGKTHLATGLAIRACQAGHRVQFATASQWVARLADAHHAGRLQDELVRLGRYPLLVVDEVGYIPFEPEAANLFFQLVSSRYERASLIVTSNKPFGRWGEVFGDDVVAAAMIDRLVHHAEVVALKGDSYRLKDRDLGRVPAVIDRRTMTEGGQFSTGERGSIFDRR